MRPSAPASVGNETVLPTNSGVGETPTENPQTKVSNNDPDKATSTEPTIWIPNAFSPEDQSGDDRIRRFCVRPNDISTIRSFEMFIYSRTGRLVFHTNDINSSWDGTSNGHAQPMGTYVYVIQVNDANTGLQHYRGTITLIR